MSNNVNELISSHLGMVKKIVKKFKPQNQEEYDELFSAGQEGLWRAAKTYNKDIAKFSTYAYRPISWAIIKKIALIKKRRLNTPIANSEKITFYQQMYHEKIVDYLPTLSESEQSIVDSLIAQKKLVEIGRELGLSKTVLRRKITKLIKYIRDSNE